MSSLNKEFHAMCCGTTCDKDEISQRISELEKAFSEAEATNAELRGRLLGGVTREEFAKKCFEAGMKSVEVRAGTTYCDVKHWLNFKALEL